MCPRYGHYPNIHALLSNLPLVLRRSILPDGLPYYDFSLPLFQSVPSKCLRQRQYLPRRSQQPLVASIWCFNTLGIFHLDNTDYNNHYDNPQLSIQSLLDSPNPNSPANAEAAKLFVQSPAEYRYLYIYKYRYKCKILVFFTYTNTNAEYRHLCSGLFFLNLARYGQLNK